jgi:hypothetical protein
MEYRRNNKIKSARQKRLLLLMEEDFTLKIVNNEFASITDLPSEEVQVRTCNQLVKTGLLKVILRESSANASIVYYKISYEGKLWCEKSRKRKPISKNGVPEESAGPVSGE